MTVAGFPPDRPWFWEGNVQSALADALTSRGWTVTGVADTESKAPGIDLVATMDGRWLAIEVKGYPNTTYDHGPKRGQAKPTQPTNQARQWFSHAFLGMMLLRDNLLPEVQDLRGPRRSHAGLLQPARLRRVLR